MLTHIKIRLGRIIGLKDLFYVLSRERAALSGDKIREFFPFRHYGVSRQIPPIGDFETADVPDILFLRFICSADRQLAVCLFIYSFFFAAIHLYI